MAETTGKAEAGVQRVLQSREETRAYYNKIAQIYDLMAEASERPMRLACLHKLAPKPGESVLEIGCGTGHSLVDIADAVGTNGKVYGLDISDKMVELAQDLIGKKGLAETVEVKRGDGTELPFEDSSFDAAFMSFTLELFDTPDIPKVLKECLRVLKPGGRLGVVAVSREGKPGVMLEVYEWTHKHFPNLLDCRPIYVQRGLEEAGFAIQDAEVQHMWIPVELVIGVKPN